MSGLGATGISIAIVFVESQYAHQQFPSHPLLPLLKVRKITLEKKDLRKSTSRKK